MSQVGILYFNKEQQNEIKQCNKNNLFTIYFDYLNNTFELSSSTTQLLVKKNWESTISMFISTHCSLSTHSNVFTNNTIEFVNLNFAGLGPSQVVSFSVKNISSSKLFV